MNRQEIMTYLPHRDSMLLVDEAICDGDKGTGKYVIKGTEFFLDGHFPGNPVVPGVILCEISAQICSVALLEVLKGQAATPYFTSLDNVKFRKSVLPGDTFCVDFELTKSKHPFYFFSVIGKVNDKKVMSGDFSFALKVN